VIGADSAGEAADTAGEAADTAGEAAEKRRALLRHVVADGAAQHEIAERNRINDGALRHLKLDDRLGK